jgi:hypothetical protein
MEKNWTNGTDGVLEIGNGRVNAGYGNGARILDRIYPRQGGTDTMGHDGDIARRIASIDYNGQEAEKEPEIGRGSMPPSHHQTSARSGKNQPTRICPRFPVQNALRLTYLPALSYNMCMVQVTERLDASATAISASCDKDTGHSPLALRRFSTPHEPARWRLNCYADLEQLLFATCCNSMG